MRKKYNTPHRKHVIKTYLNDEEYEDFISKLSTYKMSQAEFVRRAIFGTSIHPIIQVSSVSDELLSEVGKMTAEFGKIGGNMNQIARHLNQFPEPYPALAKDVTNAVVDLNTLKFDFLEKVGDAIGNVQTYQL